MKWIVTLALVAGAAALAPAAPAQALPTNLAVAVSGFGSPPSAMVVAVCPAGTVLVGAGGRIDNGGGNVVLTDVIPDINANTVTAWGNEDGAFNGMWQVEAFAVCDNQIAGRVLVTVVSANNSMDKTLNPACPMNKTLSGVGYELQSAGGNVFPEDVAPNAALTGATISAAENVAFGGQWTLIGYLICADVPMGAAPARVASVGPVNMVNSKSESAACPAGTSLTGPGGETVMGGGLVILDSLSPGAGLISSTARGQEAMNVNWGVVSYSICW